MNDITQQFAPEDIQKNKVISALSYLGILFFLPLMAAPESRFGKFHANQSLVRGLPVRWRLASSAQFWRLSGGAWR